LTGLVEGILPYLLRQQALSEPLARLARKSMREVPGAVRRLIRQGELPCQSRLHALELLKAMGADAPVAALEALSQDLEPEVQRAASLQLQASHSSHGAPLLRIFSLGPFEVFRGDERVREDEWKTQKNKYLLALLASLNGQPMAQQSILQLFWPEDPEKGKQSLYWATAVLRQVLASFHPDFKKTVVRRSQCLSLNPEVARWHDLEEVQRVATLSKERLSRGEWQGHRSLLELYRGPYLEGYHQDWVEPMRTRISREVGTALLGVAELALSHSQHQTALEFASRLVDIEPLNTEAGLAFMKALSGLGRYDQVVSYYRGLRRQLTYQDRQPPIAMVETYERAKLSV
jgi:DNA-binding SARP family transcriptional activator